MYVNEVRAYTQLEHLQGKCIPVLIGSVVFEFPAAPKDLLVEYFQTPGVLLEVIHGFPLSELTAQLPDQPRLWENIVQGAIEVAKQVNRAGVIHQDCQPKNTVVAKTNDGKFQPYMVDFAYATFKADWKDTFDLEDWNSWSQQVYANDNHGAVAVLMTQRIARTTHHKIHVEHGSPGL